MINGLNIIDYSGHGRMGNPCATRDFSYVQRLPLKNPGISLLGIVASHIRRAIDCQDGLVTPQGLFPAAATWPEPNGVKASNQQQEDASKETRMIFGKHYCTWL